MSKLVYNLEKTLQMVVRQTKVSWAVKVPTLPR